MGVCRDAGLVVEIRSAALFETYEEFGLLEVCLGADRPGECNWIGIQPLYASAIIEESNEGEAG